MKFSPLFCAILLVASSHAQQLWNGSFPGIDGQLVRYHDGDVVLTGFLAHRTTGGNAPRPTVLIVHDWNGRDSYENTRAMQIAQLGYVGFAIDVYGRVGATVEDNKNLMKPFRENRTLLLNRLNAALTFISHNSTLVDSRKLAAMGYCFGGMAVIDMARGGLNLLGVVSFHGGLDPPVPATSSQNIAAKLLVLTGYEDHGITPEKVVSFEAEMKQRNADWEMVTYSGTDHAWTVPGPKFNAQSDRRSWIAMKNFYEEIFGGSHKL